ncbi:MAG: cobalt ECF transporter T component CbiQ [Anaerolineae bacterium]
MISSWLDPYRDGKSVVHRADPRVKLVVVLALLIIISLTPAAFWPAYVAYLGTLMLLIALARLKPVDVIKRSALALPFALMAVAGVLAVREGYPLVTVPLLRWQIIITDVGLYRFLTVLARAWLSLLLVATLIMTTHFTELVVAMRGIGIPRVLTAIIGLMYRYIYVLIDEAQRMMRARDARSAEVDAAQAGGSLRWRAQVTGHMVGTLFLRTYERSERIYQAMLARGYAGEIRMLRPPVVSRRDLAAGALLIAFWALIALVAHTDPPYGMMP